MENPPPLFFLGVCTCTIQHDPTTNRAEVDKCQNQDRLETVNVNMIASQPSYIKYISTGIHNHIPLTQFFKKKNEIPKTPYINKFP